MLVGGLIKLVLLLPLTLVYGYWEPVSTIKPIVRYYGNRFGRFEWLPVPLSNINKIAANDSETHNRVALHNTCGVSWLKRNLSTAVLISSRILLAAANYLDPYFDIAKELRVWCYGASGHYAKPARYRVWRLVRVIPRSRNPQHEFTRFDRHVLRHDVAVVHMQDPVHLAKSFPTVRNQAYPASLPASNTGIPAGGCRIQGVGFENKEQLDDNYLIVFHPASSLDVVDCNQYVPKFWGPFVCFKNVDVLYGLPNGAGLHCGDRGSSKLFALGAFEIRYNEERILVFTDVRPYVDKMRELLTLSDHEYYEYAMSEYGDKDKKLTVLYPELSGKQKSKLLP